MEKKIKIFRDVDTSRLEKRMNEFAEKVNVIDFEIKGVAGSFWDSPEIIGKIIYN